jgi:hypothetical protein
MATTKKKTMTDQGIVGGSDSSLPAIERAVVGRVIETLMLEASSATFGFDKSSRRDVVRSDLGAWCELVGQLRPQLSAFWAQLTLSVKDAADAPGSVRSLLLDWVRVETYVLPPPPPPHTHTHTCRACR